MPRLCIKLMLLVEPCPTRHIYLAPDDGMDALRLAGAVKVHCAVHDAVVGDGAGRLPQFLYQLRQVPYPARTVQQTVFRMYVQMHKSHTCSPLLLPYHPAQYLRRAENKQPAVVPCRQCHGRVSGL